MKTISLKRSWLVSAFVLLSGCINPQLNPTPTDGFYRFEECKEPEAQTILTFTYGIDGVFDRSPNVYYFRKQFIQTTSAPTTRYGQGRAVRFVNADSSDRWINTSIAARNIDETGVTISTTCSYSVDGRVNGHRGDVNQDIRLQWGIDAKGQIDKFSYEAKWQGSI